MAIGRTNAGGGGVGLNFDVKDFRTEAELLASAGRENRIGVVTPVPMTGWRFDANQPENMQEGEVWISTGTSSAVAFNASKKENVMVYPLSAKQMGSGGALEKVTAKSYQGGKWVDWVVSLYSDGNDNAGITGGWYSAETVGNELVFTIPIVAANSSGFSTCKKGIDLTPYSQVTFDVAGTSEDVSTWTLGIFSDASNAGPKEFVASYADAYLKDGVYTVDVPPRFGVGYIGVGIDRRAIAVGTSNSASIRIRRITLGG